MPLPCWTFWRGEAHVSRSGYTGEDGFEISLVPADGEKLWTALLEDPESNPLALGARDSLRLEGGLCLYGHDIDETTSPNEAGLMWSIAKRRREDGGFIGATRVQNEIKNGVKRQRVGIKPEGRAPAREGTIIQNAAGPRHRQHHLRRLRPHGQWPCRHGLCRDRICHCGNTTAADCARQGIACQRHQTAVRAQPVQALKPN